MNHLSSLVSVIIPVYNVEKYIKDCLESVVNQTYKNIEIIVVDDGSPDESYKIVESFIEKDERIRLIRQKNKGLNGARETGFKASRGEYITFVDSDDILHLNFIDRLLEDIEDSDIAVGGYTYFTDKKPKSDIKNKKTLYWKRDEFIPRWIREDFSSKNIFPQTAWGKIFRRSILEEVDWSVSNYKINEDEFMSIMFYAAAHKISIVDQKLYFYRKNPNSITANYKEKPYVNHYNGEKITRSDFFANLADKRLEYFSEYKAEIFNSFMGCIGYFVLRDTLLKNSDDFSNSIEVLRRYSSEIDYSLKKTGRNDFYAEMLKVAIEKNSDGLVDWYKSKPLISVIIPVYNAEKYLEECLDSVINQSYFKIEVIIINDGSTDQSGKICDEYASRDSRIKVFHIENGGVSNARNVAISKSSGEYFTLVDSDDSLVGDGIEKMVSQLKDEVDVLSARVIFRDGDSLNTYYNPFIPTDRIFNIDNSSEVEILRFWDGLNMPMSKLYRREFIVKNKIQFPLDIRMGEDLVFVVKSLLLSKKIQAINQDVYFYRIDNYSSATKTMSNKKFDFGKALLEIDKFIKENFPKNKKIHEAFRAGVVQHSYFTFYATENSKSDHRDVFDYIKNDLWPKLNIDKTVKMLHEDDYNQMLAILEYDYEDFMLWKISYTKKHLKKLEESIAGFNVHTRNLESEIEILKSFRGSLKNFLRASKRLLAKIARKVLR
ncbi:MAG: glycosyltransferase [bacterium]|nr:glycosyltransferase [bacterium]